MEGFKKKGIAALTIEELSNSDTYEM